MIDQYTSFNSNDIIALLRGIRMTLTVTILSIAIGTAIGIVLGMICTSKNKILSSLPLIYIEPLRNSPLITQLFLVYYGLPMVSRIILNPFTAGVLTLSLNTGAFFAVLVNTSIRAVPKAQWEAGYALGHSKFSVFSRIIFRQGIRILIPPAITLYINQLQCSAFVSIIGLADLAKIGAGITQRTLMPFAIWGLVFVFYYIISFPLSKLAQYLEKRVDYSY
ncbi:MAG: amino acid ABC transporter permease [Treponema sp.]|nr:amino acid ABC transporter permease [Treponema sp.]